MNKQTLQYAVLSALTGCIITGSVNHAMAEKPSFKCSFHETNKYDLVAFADIDKLYPKPKNHGDVYLMGLGNLLRKIWQAERMIDICNRVKAGEQIEISCAAYYDQIDYDEIDNKIPDNVRESWEDHYDFTKSLKTGQTSYKDAEDHCRKIGVTR